jgi:hypothetical protein
MTEFDTLAQNYKVALLRYLPRQEEAPLYSGYKLGRSALLSRLSILHLVQIHHDVLLELLRDTPKEDLVQIATAASDFFREVLSSYDMLQREYREVED